MRTNRGVAGTVVAGALLALTASTATAAPGTATGQVGSTLSCQDGTSALASVFFTITAPSEAALEGPDVTVAGFQAVNPCPQPVSAYLNVREKNGGTLDLAFTVLPGSEVTLSQKQLRSYGINQRYRSTNGFGSASGAAVAGPGVVVLDTF
jgi:hypothetical protein